MTTAQDASVGVITESTYKTKPGAVTRWWEYLDESIDWTKGTKQGGGLRVGRRVAASGRRVNPTADGGGDLTVEACSKGMGLLWQYCLGSVVSTLVASATYQHVFTLGDAPPSFTLQKGVIEAPAAAVDPIDFLGCMVDSWEFDFPNGDIASLKATLDVGDITTANGYAAPSYPAEPVNLYHFANGTISTGTLTDATTTALATAATPLGSVRGGSISVKNNLTDDRFNLGGGGRKDKPTVGLREIDISLDIEYNAVAMRNAILADTPMVILLNFTAGALGTGVETLQLILPEIKPDSELPKTNGADMIVQSMKFTGLDNLGTPPPIKVVMRSADVTP